MTRGVGVLAEPVGCAPPRRLPRLPLRLRAVLDLLPPSTAVADIGAGHGALAAHLVARGVPRVIATEAGPGPFAELSGNLARFGVAVEARLGEGMEPLAAGEVEGAVVAGMGARTLLRIAAGATERRLSWLVLQCVQDAELVEPWLQERGWRVLRRLDVVERGRRYPTWLVEVGG